MIFTSDKVLRIALAPLTAVNSLAHLSGHSNPIRIPCLFTLVFHHTCPGCGMTRALDLLYRGHVHEAFTMNMLSPVILALVWWIFCLQVLDFHAHITAPANHLVSRF